MVNVKAIQVYCGSKDDVDPVFLKAGQEFGQCLVNAKIDLIYGSGKSGIMGAIAKTVFEQGGKVTGIIPKFLAEIYNAFDGYGETIFIDTLHERKAMMAEKADAFVALPGGFGTMEELFEIIAWQQHNIHNKPIGILNTNGYYDLLIEWIKKASNEGFLKDVIATKEVIVESDPKTLLQKILSTKDCDK